MGVMRQAQAMVLGVLTGLLAGCLTFEAKQPKDQEQTPRATEHGGSEDVVHLLVALVEKPVGDHVLNMDLWAMANEQVIDLEKKATFQDNGLRMGQLGGQLPTSLCDLIRSERSCINPRRIRTRTGTETAVVLGPRWSHCTYQVRLQGRSLPVELDQAQCQLLVTPTLAPGGKTTLHFIPSVKHGQTTMQTQAVQDPSGVLRWDLQAQEPIETYTTLSWDQTVADNEFVLVGAWEENDASLGHRCFINTDSPPPMQRVLVLRAVRAQPDAVPSDEMLGPSPSLALQAAYSAVRATAP
jgi:hypothetical protein